MKDPTLPAAGRAPAVPEDDAAPFAGTFAIDPAPSTGDAGIAARSVADDLRLARLHLRTGLHRIARAELETLAGSGDLDKAGILDLAEVRWRTGDLRGAGEAAAAYLALTARAGAAPSGPLAHAIVAEASAARGHLPEAEDAVGAALALLAGAGIADEEVPRALDALFAGITPQAPWPEVAPQVDGGAAPGTPPGAEPGSFAVPVSLDVREPVSELLGEAEDALGESDSSAAGVALALVLRLDPGRAGDVVALLDRAAADPATAGAVAAPSLALVRGDALRAIGRDDLARVAYAEARPRARPTPAIPPAPEAGRVDAAGEPPAGDADAAELPAPEQALTVLPPAEQAPAGESPAEEGAAAELQLELPVEAAELEPPVEPPTSESPASTEETEEPAAGSPAEEAGAPDGQPLPPS